MENNRLKYGETGALISPCILIQSCFSGKVSQGRFLIPSLLCRDLWQEYPEIDYVERKLDVLLELGYESIDHFVLPASSWTELYYNPLAKQVTENEQRWKGIPEAQAVLAEARKEISVFGKCSQYYGYAFFIMRR